jgi:Flp pilus assembly protein TadG
MTSPTRPGIHDTRGQAAVELALAMPFVVVLALGVLQVALVARDQLALELSAREAARAASVSADPVAAANAAARGVTTLGPLTVVVTVSGDLVRVRVSYTNTTDVAIVGAVIGDVEVAATAVMRFEPPLG